jgi:hypothetical protein
LPNLLVDDYKAGALPPNVIELFDPVRFALTRGERPALRGGGGPEKDHFTLSDFISVD